MDDGARPCRRGVAHHRGFPEILPLLRGDELDLQQHQAGQSQPPAEDHAGHRWAEDRPYRGRRLRPGDVGGARRTALDHGPERARIDGRARAGIGTADGMGLPRIRQHDGFPRRRHRRRGAGVAGRPGQGAVGRGASHPDHSADRPIRDAARGCALRWTVGRADRQGDQGRHRRRDPARWPRDRLSARGRRRRGPHGGGRPRGGDDPALSVRLAVVVTAASAGRFITLEGGEGAGKSTQIARLKSWLEGRGRSVVATREPGGSPGAEMIRKLLVEGPVERWDGTTEALLHFAARREHLHSTVWPALRRGDWVLSDRFADSTLAYQGYGHGVDRRIFHQLYKVAVGDFRPDLTLILDLPIET